MKWIKDHFNFEEMVIAIFIWVIVVFIVVGGSPPLS